VQSLAGVAQARGELRLHKGVDILRRRVYFQLAALQIRQNVLQPVGNRLALLPADDSAGREHRRVGDRTAEYPARTSGNQRKWRKLKSFTDTIQLLFKSAYPKLCHET
jgi:hypothetical protein